MVNNSYSPLLPREEKSGSKKSALIIIVVIVLFLVSGLFIINSNKSPTSDTSTTTNQSSFSILSTSTKLDDIAHDIDSLEASVSNSNLDQLDKE